MNSTAARRLSALLRRATSSPSQSLFRNYSRHLATASSIPDVLAATSASKPLKDAVKFLRPAPEKPVIWTYHELNNHVDALAAGLHELGYKSGDTIMVLLSPSSQEYPVTVLAAAKVGLSVVALPVPADPEHVEVEKIAEALNKYSPKALFIGKEFRPKEQSEEDGIVAAVHPVVKALMPNIPLEDARGTNGFVPLTGRKFVSARFPCLEHVVQTSDVNMRGSITFKSLLVYQGEVPKATGDVELLVDGASGRKILSGDVVTEAEAMGVQLGMNGDHTAKNGKVVITPTLGEKGVVGVVAAVMHETLWVNPGEGVAKEVAGSEDALLV